MVGKSNLLAIFLRVMEVGERWGTREGQSDVLCRECSNFSLQLGAEEVRLDTVPVKTDGSKISTWHIPTAQQVLAIRTI